VSVRKSEVRRGFSVGRHTREGGRRNREEGSEAV
jgi:hypothetical protein